MIKIRAFDKATNQMITEESSGLTSSQILSRYSICMLYTSTVEHECYVSQQFANKEIYTSDIIEGKVLKNKYNPNSQSTEYVDEVVLEWGSFRLKESGITLNQLDTIKVIGNIYQNKFNNNNKLILKHNLSLTLLSNELFIGSKPATEEMEIAFDKALKKSLIKEPTLLNRI